MGYEEYDYERKKIAKAMGLTGVEAKNITRELKKRNLDPQLFDWEGALSDAKDYGNRYGAAKQKLKDYYGISLDDQVKDFDKYSDQEKDMILNELMYHFESRPPQSKQLDLNINAKKQFKPTNKKGVALWKKAPNQYDIVGIDDAVAFNNLMDMEFPEAFNKKGISMLGDVDRDNVPNIMDCKPFDPNRDGALARMLNIASLGRYGQSKEAYGTEQTLKRVQTKRKLQDKIDVAKAKNQLVKQKLELQNLMNERKRMQTQKTQMKMKRTFNMVFGMPIENFNPMMQPVQITRSKVSPKKTKKPKKKKTSTKKKKTRSTSRSKPVGGLEHRFMSYPEARNAQMQLKQIYGHTPKIHELRDPFTNMTFFVVVEPYKMRI